MTLIELKKYMVAVRVASLTSLCRVFQSQPEQVRCLLNHWIRKGKIRACNQPNCAKKCSNCPAQFTESYEWITSDTTSVLLTP